MRFLFIFLSLVAADVLHAQVVIKGRIMDLSSRKPLSNVNVTVDKSTDKVLTAADGSFVIQGLEPGFHTVTAQLDGYESESSSEMLFTYDKSPEVVIEMQSLSQGIGEVNIRKTNLQRREAESPVSSQKLSIR